MIYLNQYEHKFYKTRPINTLKELVESGAELYGEKPAFLAKREKGGPYYEISHARLAADTAALGTGLLRRGLKGASIAVIGENCYQWMASYFAVVNGAGTVVPLDRELSREEIFALIRAADCRAVFYTGSYENDFRDLDIGLKVRMEVYDGESGETCGIRWETLLEEGRRALEAGDRSFEDAAPDPDEVRILLFTSGTTDEPKAVMHSHRALAFNIISTSKIVRLRPDDRSLSILPIHHTFECTIGIMTVLFQGGSVAFCEGLKYINRNMEESRCSVLVGVPLIFESIYDKIWKQAEKTGRTARLKTAVKLNRTLQALGIRRGRQIFRPIYRMLGGRIRLFVTGAAAVSPKVVRGFLDFGIDVVMGYGLTETAPLLTGTPDFSDRYKKAGSAGPVIPYGELSLAGRDGEGIGEIIYRGPNVMKGYYRMPEKTAEVLKDGWFYTGDLGFVDKDGWLYITGRRKNVIVTKTGKNIYPEEIEARLKQIPYIEECMVYGLDREGEEEDTLVSAQVRPDRERISEALGTEYADEDAYRLIKKEIAEMNQTLPSYKRIRSVILRKEEFIKTTTRKIKRHRNV